MSKTIKPLSYNNKSTFFINKRLKVDLTPYIDEYRFNFDGAYDEYATN